MHKAIVTPERIERVKLAEMTFTALRAQQEYENKLLEMGFNFEYGEGAVGSFLLSNKNALLDTLEYLLGFERKTFKIRTNVFGEMMPCTLDIFMPEDGDFDFAISEDDFSDCVYKAIDNEELSQLIIRIWIEKDEEAKNTLNNTLGATRISPKVGVRSLLEFHGIYQEGE